MLKCRYKGVIDRMAKRKKEPYPVIEFFDRRNPHPGTKAEKRVVNEPVIIPDYEQLVPEDDLPTFGDEFLEPMNEKTMEQQAVVKEEHTMAKADVLKKSKDKGKEVWGKIFPKLPAFQEGRGRLDSRVLDDHYEKMLALGREGLRKFFSDNAGLSGVQQRQVGSESKEQLKSYRKSLPADLDGVEKGQIWQALQMASQEIFLKKELQSSDKIPHRHAWQFAEHPNDAIKIRMLNDYIAKMSKVEREVSANYVKRLLLEYKIRRGYEQPGKEAESKKNLTPQDIMVSVGKCDLSAITAMEGTEFIAMVNELNIDQCKQLKNAIDKVKEWLSKGDSDYVDYRISRKSA